MSPILAASLSVVPGAGHWVVGKRGKAIAFFAVDLGIVCALLFLRSPIALLLACVTYFMIMVPAVIETWTIARGGVSQFSESKPYIVLLLLVTGLPALPLLWQSRSFSKRMKIAWSIVVPALAVLWFGFLGAYGIRFLHYVKNGLG
jgi:hypothetical protein